MTLFRFPFYSRNEEHDQNPDSSPYNVSTLGSPFLPHPTDTVCPTEMMTCRNLVFYTTSRLRTSFFRQSHSRSCSLHSSGRKTSQETDTTCPNPTVFPVTSGRPPLDVRHRPPTLTLLPSYLNHPNQTAASPQT